MATGKVAEIVLDSGYGFVDSPTHGRVFFHQRWMQSAKFRELKVGDEVIFNLDMGPRGVRARNLDILSAVDSTQRMAYEAADLAFTNRKQRPTGAESRRENREQDDTPLGIIDPAVVHAQRGSKDKGRGRPESRPSGVINASGSPSSTVGEKSSRWHKKILSIFKD